MRLVLAFLVLVFASALTAQAQKLDDVVYLKDGGIVRGVLIEQVPGESVLIRTDGGNQFRYSMNQVIRITREGSQASQVPTRQIKSPGGALALSFLLPGAGQWYNGQVGKGFLHLGLAAAAGAVAYAGFTSEACLGDYYYYWDTYYEEYVDGGSEGGNCALGYAGLAAALGIRVWSMVDASATAKSINKAQAVALTVQPHFDTHALSHRVTPSLRVGFQIRTY